MKKTDVVILGAGPAGVTCAIYLKRANIDFVLIEKGSVGGKVNLTADVDNYPPYKHISGVDFAFALYEDLLHNQIDVHFEEAKEIKKENDDFIVTTDNETYQCKTVFFALGTKDLHLNVLNEEKFLHKGISNCAICDGNLFKGQTMAVVGGGNSALEETLYLSKITDKIYLIHRRNEFRGSAQYVSMVKSDPHVEILTPYVIKECHGEEKLSSLIVENLETKELKTLNVAALFEYVGAKPATDIISFKEILNEKGYVKVKIDMSTDVPGFFAGGDVTDKKLRQIAVAIGDGANASQSIIDYLNSRK